MHLPFDEYRRKVLGCWLGKAVGGTLGGPWEGKEGPLDLTFYDPVPSEMLPNDDLDLQVVWLETIRRRGLPVDRRSLADAWLDHIHMWPDEYGVACRNLAQGVFPPASGAFDNGFTAGMGAAIRSELWACLAPGDPELAAALALEDACVDHAGEGIYAERFLVALQSAAFVENDRETLLDQAAATIPADCRVACAVRDTRSWWADTGDWRETRIRVLEAHGRQNFTDVAQNLAITVLGWLAGEGDFGKAICIAVNCGKDTDCTGATLGALLGILDPDCIGEKWLEPIGRELVLSPSIVGMHQAATLDQFTDQVAAAALDVLDYYGSTVRLVEAPALSDTRENMAAARISHTPGVALNPDAPGEESLLSTEPLVVSLVYPEGIAMVPGRSDKVTLKLVNPTADAMDVCIEPRVPDGWHVSCHRDAFRLTPSVPATTDLLVTPPGEDALRTYRNPLDIRFRAGGFTWSIAAGLPLAMPWLRWGLPEWPSAGDACPALPSSAERVEVCGHSQSLPAGATACALDVKLSRHCVPRWIAQTESRPVRVWLDGDLINEHDGTYQVPAVHRARHTGADVEVRGGWHRVVIAVGPGPEGHLFFGLGDGKTWDWLRDAEFRFIMAAK
jgi:ADP-ribosylglycohydrolase